MEIHGECDPQFSKVKETFKKLHQEDREIGSCFAVYKDGKPLVDLWGGLPSLYTAKQEPISRFMGRFSR